MIAVIADDLTGAAELGGIGIRHGLVTEISMTVNGATDADLLVIAADTRSMGEAAAVEGMTAITRQLRLLKPEWVYKKVDSVLRGHIVAEINAQLEVLGWSSALLAPANPALGRTIRDGHYYVNEAPVHETSFSDDPEFAIRSSDVREMLRAPVAIRRVGEELPGAGIVLGEVRDGGDLMCWAARSGPEMLTAGGSGFFSALLSARQVKGRRAVDAPPSGGPVLIVSGTTFDHSRAAVRRLHQAGGPVSYMPVSGGPVIMDRWASGVSRLLRDQGRAVIAIETTDGSLSLSAALLRAVMAAEVGRIMGEVTIGELIIEGGATAYAILQQLGLRTFYPEEELAPGVIRMSALSAPGLYITVKPGSYQWPERIKI
jgi:uncharacterized protein YgbK (DUF1537 family)